MVACFFETVCLLKQCTLLVECSSERKNALYFVRVMRTAAPAFKLAFVTFIQQGRYGIQIIHPTDFSEDM